MARVAFNCYPVTGFIHFSLKWEATVVEGDLKTKQILIKLNGPSKTFQSLQKDTIVEGPPKCHATRERRAVQTTTFRR